MYGFIIRLIVVVASKNGLRIKASLDSILRCSFKLDLWYVTKLTEGWAVQKRLKPSVWDLHSQQKYTDKVLVATFFLDSPPTPCPLIASLCEVSGWGKCVLSVEFHLQDSGVYLCLRFQRAVLLIFHGQLTTTADTVVTWHVGTARMGLPKGNVVGGDVETDTSSRVRASCVSNHGAVTGSSRNSGRS